MEGGKGMLWVAIKKVCANKRLFAHKKAVFWGQFVKLSVNENLLFCWKGLFFQHMQSQLIKKSFFQLTTTPTSHCNKTNVQQPFSNIACYCELAVKQLFFEKSQSCVCTTVTLSHRFKAFSPAFCGQNRFRQKPPEVSAKSLPTELWIVPGVQRFANLWCAFWFFLHNAKSTKNVPFAGSFEV